MSFLNLLAQFDNADTIERLSEIAGQMADEYNFSHYLFMLHKIHTPTNRENIIITNYPDAWQSHYKQNKARCIDPHIRYAFTSVNAVSWADLEKNLELVKDKKALTFLHSAHEYGLTSGLTIPVRSPDGDKGYFAFYKENESKHELRPRIPKVLPFLNTLAIYYCTSVNKISTQEEPPQTKMTARELEIMRWVAEGKDNEMIANILNISVSAVAFHIRNIYKKLDAANRANAVAKAFLYGDLHNP